MTIVTYQLPPTRRCRRRVAGAAVLAAGLTAAALSPAPAGAQEPARRDSAAPAPKRTPDVIYVPTPPEVVRQMLDVARVTKNDVIYDLGSGDGRIVIEAARRYGAQGTGIDINPERIREANANAKKAGVTGRVRFLEQDLFETDISPATVVTLYLLPSLNVKLRPTLFKTLQPGTRIVSHDFDMGDWQPDSTMRVSSETRGTSTVYYWVLPANVAGRWTVEVNGGSGGAARGPGDAGGSGAQRYTLELQQQYQRVTGSATIGGRTIPLSDPTLVGDRLTFTVADTAGGRAATLRFSGRVSGDRITGTLRGGGAGERSWRATRSQSGRAARQTGAAPSTPAPSTRSVAAR